MDTFDRRLMLGAAGLAGVAAFSKFASPARGGPLEPPPGPIAPTGRTLEEVYGRIARTDAGIAEPRIPIQSLPGSETALHVITQPGSYYLTDNIAGVEGKNGIEIAASNVSIDLCGYALVGTATVRGDSAIRAVGDDVSLKNIAVRNGHILYWWNAGLDLRASNVSTIADLSVQHCAGKNGSIRASSLATIARCTVRFSGSYAISVDFAGAAVLDCVIAESGGGVQAGGGAFVARNSVGFSGPALVVNDRSIVIDNQVVNCVSGISVASFCRVEGNNVTGCETGIRAGDGNTVRANVVADCGTHYLGETPGSLYVNNTSHGPGVAFSLAPGNAHGPIVNVAGAGDISGVPGANHPSANFVY